MCVSFQVKYSIVQQPNQKGTKFTVDEETGEVSTNKVFDREGDDGKFVSVTVKATDQGEPSLEGVCSFTVEITDVNDNPPLFDRQVSGPVIYWGWSVLQKRIMGAIDLFT